MLDSHDEAERFRHIFDRLTAIEDQQAVFREMIASRQLGGQQLPSRVRVIVPRKLGDKP